jgi:hypothetical protein
VGVAFCRRVGDARSRGYRQAPGILELATREYQVVGRPASHRATLRAYRWRVTTAPYSLKGEFMRMSTVEGLL